MKNKLVQRIMINALLYFILLLTTINAQSKFQKVDSLITYCYENGLFNGTILLAENQNVFYKKAFGYADLSNKEILEPDHQFYLASVSKQFTTMAIMMLKERGQLSYDNKLSGYFSEFPDYADKVTIRHLMTHTSGIPNHYRLVEQIEGLSNKDAFDKLIKVDHPDFEPGTKYSYSNGGFILLAMIVEKVSGMSLHNFLEDNVFKPLGMNNTVVYDSDYKLNKRVKGYNLYDYEDDYKFFTTGAGGIYSTVEDLFKWDQALYTNKLVSSVTLEEAFTPYRLVDNSFTEYGFGWVIVHEENIVSHGGALAGFRTYIERQLSDKNTIIMLTNKGGAVQIRAIRDAVNSILNDEPFDLPLIPIRLVLNKYYRSEGIDKTLKVYHELKNYKIDLYDFSENQLNLFGYYVLNINAEDAVKVFELNTLEYPDAYNTYDSLGEAYYVLGDFDKALDNYKKSIELNPKNNNAKEMINKIKIKMGIK